MEAHWKPAVPAFERPEPKMDRLEDWEAELLEKATKSMDPEQTLSEMRYFLGQLNKADDGQDIDDLVHNVLFELAERAGALDEWMTKGGFSPWPARKEPNRFADQRARMSDAQRNRLWQMCADYNVPFREDDYAPDFGWPTGNYLGWIGGFYHGDGNSSSNDGKPENKKTIYVCVELDGRSHT